MAVKSDGELFQATPAKSKWQSLTAEEARQNALFGIFGWPLFFLISPLLKSTSVILAPIGQFMADEADLEKFFVFSEVNWTAMNAYNFIVGVANALLVYLVFTKHAKAARYWVILLWLEFLSLHLYSFIFSPFGVGLSPVQVIFGVATFFGFFFELVIVVLLSWYLEESKRVNVTFRHRMPAQIDKADWDLRTEAGQAFRRGVRKRQIIISSVIGLPLVGLALLFTTLFVLGDPVDPAPGFPLERP